MAYDATKPAIADNYSTGYTQAIRDNLGELLKLCDATSFTGTIPTGAKRYNATSKLFEKYSGGWSEMELDYLKKTNAGSVTVTGTVNFSGTLQMGGYTVWHANNFDPATKAAVAGQTFTGPISTNSTNAITAGGRLFGGGGGGNGLRVITVSTSDASGGSQGDIWFKV